MPASYKLLGGIAFIAILMIGCSDSKAPFSAPSIDYPPGDIAQHQTDLSITENALYVSSPDQNEEAHFLWSYAMVFVDMEGKNFELIPLRQVQTHWNVLQWLEKGPCTNCVAIKGIEPSGSGTFLVDIEIRHPFVTANLTGFDVRGITMFSGSHEFPGAGVVMSDRSKGEGELVNADGFTTLYNPETAGSGPDGLQGYLKGKFASASYPNSTLNGYIRHVSNDPLNTRNAFYSGSSIVRTYEIGMPAGPFIFGYAVDASWAPPSNKPVNDPMADFPSGANCPEPWKVSVNQIPVGQGLTDQGGSLKIDIDVYDWQGKDTNYAPGLECPKVFDGLVGADWIEDGTGYTRYEVTVSNEKMAGVGEYMCLIGVRDKADAGAPEWLDLTAYQVITLKVAEWGNVDPVAAAGADPPEQTVCETVSFDGSGSYDPDGGSIVKYEWDWESDGTYDEEGVSADRVWNEVGVYEVQLRVTDEEGSSDELDDALEVTIQNVLPAAVAEASDYEIQLGEEVSIDGSGSHDNDCSGQEIVKYEWDPEYDGTFDPWPTINAGGFSIKYVTTGLHKIQLRVTDDEGATDMLDSPLEISVGTFKPIAFAKFSPNPQMVCEEVTFEDDGSYDPDGGLIVKYEWDWNSDGVYDEEGITVTHSWDKDGTYPVQLRVTDDDGETDVLNTPLEAVIDQNYPTAILSPPGTNNTCEGVPFLLDASLSHDNDCNGSSIVLYEWDWENDGIYDDTGVTVEHSFTADDDPPTEFDVMLRITDNEGYTDTLDSPFTVFVFGKPVAKATVNHWVEEVCDPIHFYDDGSDAGGFVLTKQSWDWNNDGVFEEEGSSVYHSWDVPGEYYVQYRVVSMGEGCSDTLDTPLKVTINNAAPSAIASCDPQTAMPEDIITFDGSGSQDNDCGGESIVSWEWDWENDGIFDVKLYEPVTTHSYSQSGTYEVVLMVTDNEGVGSSSTPLVVNIANGWAKTWGASGNDTAYCVSADWFGNAYVAGAFNNTVDFDPGPGVVQATSNGDTDAFLCKFDSKGSFKWVKTWGNSNADWVSGIVADNGHKVWATGSFSGSVDFNPDDGSEIHASNGYQDAYLSEFDSNGNWEFTKTWGGSDNDTAVSVTTDFSSSGTPYVYVTGTYRNSVDFNPNSGTDTHSAVGGIDGFLLKLDWYGGFLWAKTWGGTSSEGGNCVATDYSNDPFVVGSFYGTCDFDPGAGTDNRTPVGQGDVFLLKLVDNGDYAWTKTWGGSDYDNGNAVFGALNSDPYVYVTGDFKGMVDFNPGVGTDNHWSNGLEDIFLSKIGADGSYQWCRTWGGWEGDSGMSLCGNAMANAVYVAGSFTTLVDFDPGPGTVNRTSNGARDAFLSRFDSSGNFEWVGAWGSTGIDSAKSVSLGLPDMTYVSGYFSGTVDFNPGAGIWNSASNGLFDVFLARYPSNGQW